MHNEASLTEPPPIPLCLRNNSKRWNHVMTTQVKYLSEALHENNAVKALKWMDLLTDSITCVMKQVDEIEVANKEKRLRQANIS